jgi:hypothetical protein
MIPKNIGKKTFAWMDWTNGHVGRGIDGAVAREGDETHQDLEGTKYPRVLERDRRGAVRPAHFGEGLDGELLVELARQAALERLSRALGHPPVEDEGVWREPRDRKCFEEAAPVVKCGAGAPDISSMGVAHQGQLRGQLFELGGDLVEARHHPGDRLRGTLSTIGRGNGDFLDTSSRKDALDRFRPRRRKGEQDCRLSAVQGLHSHLEIVPGDVPDAGAEFFQHRLVGPLQNQAVRRGSRGRGNLRRQERLKGGEEVPVLLDELALLHERHADVLEGVELAAKPAHPSGPARHVGAIGDFDGALDRLRASEVGEVGEDALDVFEGTADVANLPLLGGKEGGRLQELTLDRKVGDVERSEILEHAECFRQLRSPAQQPYFGHGKDHRSPSEGDAVARR